MFEQKWVEEGPIQPLKAVAEEDLVHLANKELDWQLRETARGMLTDGHVSEDLQRDRIRQIVQWLHHFPERLPLMEAFTADGREALRRARTNESRNDRQSGPNW